MLDLNKDFDEIENLVYASFCPPKNVALEDWYFAVGNEMWCELLYNVNTHKKWQKQLLRKATDGIAFENYLRPYSDKKGNICFYGNCRNYSCNVIPKSSNSLVVYMQNLDTGQESAQFIQEIIIDAAIKNNKRIPLQFV
ncbi:MAG: hypothetical protein LBC53_04070 [Spirochaetaceae bacterium]|jgi:hypothetical protein|nr:hypothetical protein [Spirochaetaceae bacterium]